MKLLRYLWGSFHHPRRGDYIDMGLGIEARAVKFKKHWAKHLELSKNFQRSAFEDLKGEGLSLAVLGAGRLLDLDREFIAKRFKKISLFDADPLCFSVWKRWRDSVPGCQIDFNFIDLSGSIDTWSESLQSFLKSGQKSDVAALNDFFTTLQLHEHPLSAESFDAVLSTNLLSQIPLYWRDRAERMLKKQWGIETAQGLGTSMGKLQAQHLALVSALNAKRIALIFDREFMYYKPDTAIWQCESALYDESGFDLPGYQISRRDSWLWHILPFGKEQREFGAIHSVQALAWAQ